MDLVQYLKKQIDWSENTFGPNERLNGVLDHIREELVEVELNPSDLEEWVDVMILSFDGAWRQGYSAEQIAAALEHKQRKNFGRTFPDWREFTDDQKINHDRNVPDGELSH